jgi:hypothetical protein
MRAAVRKWAIVAPGTVPTNNCHAAAQPVRGPLICGRVASRRGGGAGSAWHATTKLGAGVSSGGLVAPQRIDVRRGVQGSADRDSSAWESNANPAKAAAVREPRSQLEHRHGSREHRRQTHGLLGEMPQFREAFLPIREEPE